MPLSLRAYFVASLALLGAVIMTYIPALPQDPHYHQFADQRTIFACENFFNVISNLPFLLIGIFGLWRSYTFSVQHARPAYLMLALGVCFTALGSGYYHAAPSNASLVWDRLPMTISFMSLLMLLLQERLQVRGFFLWPCLALGMLSVAYWYTTEMAGHGDLRPYLLVQFLPVLLTPVILLLFPQQYLRDRYLWAALALYVVAKLCEHYDLALLETLQIVSGHSIKHGLAALAVWCIVLAPTSKPRLAKPQRPAPRLAWRFAR